MSNPFETTAGADRSLESMDSDRDQDRDPYRDPSGSDGLNEADFSPVPGKGLACRRFSPEVEMDEDKSFEFETTGSGESAEAPDSREHYTVCALSAQMNRTHGGKFKKMSDDARIITAHLKKTVPRFGLTAHVDEEGTLYLTNTGYQTIPAGTPLSVPAGIIEEFDSKKFGTYRYAIDGISKSSAFDLNAIPSISRDQFLNVVDGARIPHSCDPNAASLGCGCDMRIQNTVPLNAVSYKVNFDQSDDESTGRALEKAKDFKTSQKVDTDSEGGSLPGTPKSRGGTPTARAEKTCSKNPYEIMDRENSGNQEPSRVGRRLKEFGLKLSEQAGSVIVIWTTKPIHPGDKVKVDYGRGYVNGEREIKNIIEGLTGGVGMRPCTCQAEDSETLEKENLNRLIETRTFIFDKNGEEVLETSKPEYLTEREMMDKFLNCQGGIKTGDVTGNCPNNFVCLHKPPTQKLLDTLKEINAMAIAKLNEWKAENDERHRENEARMREAEEKNRLTYNVFMSFIGYESNDPETGSVDPAYALHESVTCKNGIQGFFEWINKCGLVLISIIIRNHKKYGVKVVDCKTVCTRGAPPNTLLFLALGHLMEIFEIPMHDLCAETRLNRLIGHAFSSIVDPRKHPSGFALEQFSLGSLKYSCDGLLHIYKTTESLEKLEEYEEPTDSEDSGEDIYFADGKRQGLFTNDELVRSILGETAAGILNEPFEVGPGEFLKCRDTAVLVITNNPVPPLSELTLNPKDRNPDNVSMFIAENSEIVLEKNPPDTVLISCQCSGRYPCPGNFLYIDNAVRNPACMTHPSRVDRPNSRYSALTREESYKRNAEAIVMELQAIAPQWAKDSHEQAEHYKEHEKNVRKLLAERFPECDIDKILGELDEIDRGVQERLAVPLRVITTSSDMQKKKEGFVGAKRKIVAKLESVDEGSAGSAIQAKLPGTAQQTESTKRKRSEESDEEHSDDFSDHPSTDKRLKRSNILPEGSSRRERLWCHYCGEEVKTREKVDIVDGKHK